MDVQTQVIKFFAGTTTTNKQKWDVYFANGTKATAWEYAVAAKAEQAWKSGEFITAQVEEKPNPNGGNPYRNLQGVILGAPATTRSQVAQTDPQPLGGPQKPLGGFSGGMTPEDKIRVTKLSCISSAAAIFGGSGDVGEALKAAAVIFNEVWAPKPAEVPVVAPEPAAVGAFVNAEVGASVVQVGLSESAIPQVQGQSPVHVEEKPALPWAVA